MINKGDLPAARHMMMRAGLTSPPEHVLPPSVRVTHPHWVGIVRVPRHRTTRTFVGGAGGGLVLWPPK